MPKTNFCKDMKKEKQEKRSASFREMLSGKMSYYGLKYSDLSKKTGIPERTLRARYDDPEKIKLGELWMILDALKPEMSYIEKIL